MLVIVLPQKQNPRTSLGGSGTTIHTEMRVYLAEGDIRLDHAIRLTMQHKKKIPPLLSTFN